MTTTNTNTTITTTTITTIVSIKSKTWNKESEELFDYDSNQTHDQDFETASSVGVCKTGSMVMLINDLPEGGEVDNSSVFNLKNNKGSFSVCRTNIKEKSPANKEENIWEVVKRVFPGKSYKGHTLVQGDIVKFGKIKLRIRELHVPEVSKENKEGKRNKFSENLEESKEEQEPNSPSMTDFLKKTDVEEIPEEQLNVKEFTCRICLEDECSDANPFITPCLCSGSVKHIHLECLKQWITSRCFTKQTEDCTMYMFRDLECELCHQALPDSFLYKGKEVELVDVLRPETPYIIFETLPEKKDFKKVFYVATVSSKNKENYLRIGRKGDCHVRINDISVSRLHALIKFSNNKFYLENGYSKFGTLVQLKNDIQLLKEHDISIQVGRTVLSFTCIDKEVAVTAEEKSQEREEIQKDDEVIIEELKEEKEDVEEPQKRAEIEKEEPEVKEEEEEKADVLKSEDDEEKKDEKTIIVEKEEEEKSVNYSILRGLRDEPSYRKLSCTSMDDMYLATIDNLDAVKSNILDIPSSYEEKNFSSSSTSLQYDDAQIKSEIEKLDKVLEALRGALDSHYKSAETSEGSIKELRLSQNDLIFLSSKDETLRNSKDTYNFKSTDNESLVLKAEGGVLGEEEEKGF